MMRSLLALGLLAIPACVTTVNPVAYKPDATAPQLPERPDGCAVEIFDENEKPPQAFKTFGRLELSWSQTQLTEQGPEGAMRTLRAAVCEKGGHYVVNLRALPRGFKEGMFYEGDIAYIVDADGKPLMGVASGTASSSAGVSGGEAAPPPAPAPAPTP